MHVPVWLFRSHIDLVTSNDGGLHGAWLLQSSLNFWLNDKSLIVFVFLGRFDTASDWGSYPHPSKRLLNEALFFFFVSIFFPVLAPCLLCMSSGWPSHMYLFVWSVCVLSLFSSLFGTLTSTISQITLKQLGTFSFSLMRNLSYKWILCVLYRTETSGILKLIEWTHRHRATTWALPDHVPVLFCPTCCLKYDVI